MGVNTKAITGSSSGNRVVVWTDSDGRKFNSVIPANAPDSAAPKGVKYGPPPLTELGLPKDVSVRLHNELFAQGLFSFDDVRYRIGDITSAIQQALRLDAQTVQTAYYRKEHPDG